MQVESQDKHLWSLVLTDRAGNQLQPFGAGVKQSKPEWFHAQAGNRLPP